MDVNKKTRQTAGFSFVIPSKLNKARSRTSMKEVKKEYMVKPSAY